MYRKLNFSVLPIEIKSGKDYYIHSALNIKIIMFLEQ